MREDKKWSEFSSPSLGNPILSIRKINYQPTRSATSFPRTTGPRRTSSNHFVMYVLPINQLRLPAHSYRFRYHVPFLLASLSTLVILTVHIRDLGLPRYIARRGFVCPALTQVGLPHNIELLFSEGSVTVMMKIVQFRAHDLLEEISVNFENTHYKR